MTFSLVYVINLVSNLKKIQTGRVIRCSTVNWSVFLLGLFLLRSSEASFFLLSKARSDVWQLESVSFELLNIVENVSDAIYWYLLQVVEPLIDNFEKALVLVRLADILDDVLAV